MSSAISACGAQAKTGSPKVHSLTKACARTGSKGSDSPSASVL